MRCAMKSAYSELVVGHHKGCCKSRFQREVECRVVKTVSARKAFLRERKRQVEEMAEKCQGLSRTRGEGQWQPSSSWGWGFSPRRAPKHNCTPTATFKLQLHT